MSYPRPIPSPLILQDPKPATIIAPRAGVITVQHYVGNTGRPDLGRLWLTRPDPFAREITNGAASRAWPGDTFSFPVEAGDEIELFELGSSSTSNPPGNPNPGPTFSNKSNNARVHEITDYPRDPVEWGRYIEWEDLTLVMGSNNHYNDNRTLIYYPAGGWVVGAVAVG